MSSSQRRNIVLTDPHQIKAIAHPVRTRILSRLEAGPASAKMLASELKLTHGNAGHHLKVLKKAGLIVVAEERQVRAMTERFFAPAYRQLRIDTNATGVDRLRFLFQQAIREAAPHAEQPFPDDPRLYAVRMTDDRAQEFSRRVRELADEFADAGEGAADGVGTLYGIAAAVYRVNR